MDGGIEGGITCSDGDWMGVGVDSVTTVGVTDLVLCIIFVCFNTGLGVVVLVERTCGRGDAWDSATE
jgi:hypothetical protein